MYLIYAIGRGIVVGSKWYQEQDQSFDLGDQTERSFIVDAINDGILLFSGKSLFV